MLPSWSDESTEVLTIIMFSLLEYERKKENKHEAGQNCGSSEPVNEQRTHGYTFTAIRRGIRIKIIAAHATASFLAWSPPIGNLAAKLPIGMSPKTMAQKAEKKVYMRRLLNRRWM